MNFFYAMTMWAKATGSSKLEGLGRLQTGVVVRSIDAYFLLKDSNVNHPGDFVRNKVRRTVWACVLVVVHCGFDAPGESPTPGTEQRAVKAPCSFSTQDSKSGVASTAQCRCWLGGSYRERCEVIALCRGVYTVNGVGCATRQGCWLYTGGLRRSLPAEDRPFLCHLSQRFFPCHFQSAVEALPDPDISGANDMDI